MLTCAAELTSDPKAIPQDRTSLTYHFILLQYFLNKSYTRSEHNKIECAARPFMHRFTVVQALLQETSHVHGPQHIVVGREAEIQRNGY